MTLLEGFIKVPNDGEYSFSLQASGKAYMRIHEAELIDADFGYQSVSQETERVYLKAGYHPVKIYYLREAGKERILSLKMRYKDGDWKPLKGTDFFSVK
ncbi:PA14 domain-containing protein [Pedobacter steynii]